MYNVYLIYIYIYVHTNRLVNLYYVYNCNNISSQNPTPTCVMCIVKCIGRVSFGKSTLIAKNNCAKRMPCKYPPYFVGGGGQGGRRGINSLSNWSKANRLTYILREACGLYWLHFGNVSLQQQTGFLVLSDNLLLGFINLILSVPNGAQPIKW